MGFPVSEQSINAVRDDGSETGVLSAELRRMGLVYMPFRRGGEQDGSSSSGGIAGVQSSVGQTSFSSNGDGSGQMLLLNAPASATLNNYAMAGFWFAGNIFGLRYDVGVSDVTAIGVMIDRVAYPVRGTRLLRPDSMQSSNAVAMAYQEVLARDLGDGMHYCELSVPGRLTTSNIARIWGYIVDQAAGYRGPGPSSVIGNSIVAVLTTATYLTGQSSSVNGNMQSVKVLTFNNTTASPITITISDAVGTVASGITVPANGSIPYDFGIELGNLCDIKLTASAVGVNVRAMGRGYSV